MFSVPQATSAIDAYIISTVKERDIKDLPINSGLSAFMKLGSSNPIGLFRKGSFALLGYKGQPNPPWIKIINRAVGLEAASLQQYVPLNLNEYRCPGQGREYRKDEKLLRGLLQQNQLELEGWRGP
ncbi:cell surface hyaluronidase-like isoform X2 [Polyodon spathula]|uniref:cell surface hyaluronidase-like isoform X2 n=1 Tax=Polyodon spathula TaxID=7913 RepID=UPI001B7EB175|nr:cell surface hyaluronidase-like isoform X2 [Polyodon spathula]